MQTESIIIVPSSSYSVNSKVLIMRAIKLQTCLDQLR
jgi:hypothetical protein